MKWFIVILIIVFSSGTITLIFTQTGLRKTIHHPVRIEPETTISEKDLNGPIGNAFMPASEEQNPKLQFKNFIVNIP
jgi:hypothetical protein